jgi:hypothetical protein
MKHFLISLPLISILFTGCGQGYKKENGRWAWVSWDEAVGRRVQFVDGVDNGSFHVLSDKEYAADQKSVYHRNLRIQSADPASFRRIDRFYWRDANSVFFVDAEIPGADPETFKPLSKYPWSRDKTDVYTGTTALHVRDISSFTLLQGVWAKDSKAYYANGGMLAYKTVPCDYASFVVLNGSYAKDKTRGYWQGMPIDGSDGASFDAISEFLAKDKYRTYRGHREQPINQGR